MTILRPPDPEPFAAHVTVRISSGVVRAGDTEKHYAELRKLVEFMRSLRAAGWRDISFDVAETPTT